MNLLDYINGDKKGKEAHRLEKEAMQNSFLSEAIEGFEIVDDNHTERLNDIYSIINKKAGKTKKKPFPIRQLVAACISLLVISSAIFLLVNEGNNKLQLAVASEASPPIEIIEVYVPTSVYEQNIAIIAQNNTTQFRQYQSELTISNHLKDRILDQNSAQANLDELVIITDSNDPIDIFIPKEGLHEQMASVLAISENEDAPPVPSAKMMLRSSSPAKAKVTKETSSIEPQCGFDEYGKYIKKNCQVSTPVSVVFDTNDAGIPINIEILEGKDKTLNEKIILLIGEGSKWTPSQSEIRYTIRP